MHINLLYKVTKTLVILIILIIYTLEYTKAQDYSFSQFNISRNYYNPAFTGIDPGMLETNMIYRNSWPKLPGHFSTQYINIDYKAFTSSGMGIFILIDTQGESLLTSNTFGASYSWRGKINRKKNSFWQLGVSGSYNIKSINYDNLMFSDELDEIYGNIYPSSFTSDVNSINYLDFSVGALIHFPLIISNRKLSINTIGFAFHHISLPKISFQAQETRLPMKLSFHARSKFITDVYSLDNDEKMTISPTILVNIQDNNILAHNANNSLLVGVDIDSNPISGGIWYRSQMFNTSKKTYENLIFKFATKLYSHNKRIIYKISYTYDVATANYSETTRESHELGLSIKFMLRKRCHNFNF